MKKICIVSSMYYEDIMIMLAEGANQAIEDHKKHFAKVLKKKIKIDYIYVTGAFEIPYIISKNINKYDAFIALGCVIKGETPHFDYICRSTIDALMRISVQNKKPIGNGILTCLNKNQAIKRADRLKKNKGKEAVDAVIELLKIDF